MSKILILPLLLTMAVAGVTELRAAELRMTVEKPRFTCEGRGRLLSHVAYVPGEYRDGVGGAVPLPCCNGQVGCAQFLSTNTVLRPERPTRG